MEFEFSSTYAHILISGQSNNPEELFNELKNEINQTKKEGIKEDFKRIKKMLYGDYIKDYNDASNIARMFLVDYFKGVDSFQYLEQMESIHLEDLTQVLEDVFDENKMVLSIVK